MGRMCPPSAHFIGAHGVARTKIAKKVQLLEKLSKLRWTGGGTKMLYSLLSVLSKEKLVVIHREEKKGYILNISGIADNHQLQTLLLGSLCGLSDAEKLSGNPPAPRVLDTLKNPDAPQSVEDNIIGPWQLEHWTAAVLPIASIEDVNKTSVSGEGIPADISNFRGERVLLLRRAVKQNSWGTVRVFGPLAADVTVERVLTAEEVEKYLADFTSATEEEKATAVEDILKAVNMSATPAVPAAE